MRDADPPGEWMANAVTAMSTDNNEEEKEEDGDDIHFDVLGDDWFDAEESFEDIPASSDDSPFDSKPLYEGAPLTLAESMLLILTLGLRHSLTGSCLVDILTLVCLHCKHPNLCKTTLHLFKKYFSNLKMPLVFHQFCSVCGFLLNKQQNSCPCCHKQITSKKDKTYFIEIPILAQIQALFQQKDFSGDLQHRFQRKNDGTIRDIYDGLLYKKFSQPGGLLQNPNNISFMWNTDGVPIFKSSKFQIWPLYFLINELPPTKRFLKEKMVIAGLWYGEGKPHMNTFLKPFHTSLQDLSSGVNICNYLGMEQKVKGILLCGTCDMPAKCSVLNMTQFNGLYGCPKCTQPGEVISVGRGHARVFPCDLTTLDDSKRTHDQTKMCAEQAFQMGKPILGIKGPSWFLYHMPDLINGTAIDWMHQVLLGIVRRLLKLWFDSSHSSQPYSISHLLSAADARLKNLKPPNFIGRVPRSIRDHRKYWKASECRSWLFYYSLPVLSGLLLDMYFQHYLLLVEAVYLLNVDSISHETIDHCEQVLQHFCMMHETLYSKSEMTSNIHQLLHLCDVVRNLGPLWVYSCFTFESINGELLSLFHGTQNVDMQIANSVAIFLKYPLLVQDLKLDSEVGKFFSRMRFSSHKYKKGKHMFHNYYILGVTKKYTLKRMEQTVIRRLVGHAVCREVQSFLRVMWDSTVICSKEYTLAYQRNSYTVMFYQDETLSFGRVHKYIELTPSAPCSCDGICSCSIYIALIEKFQVVDFHLSNDDMTSAKVSHLVPCRKDGFELVAVEIKDIIELCVFMEIDDCDYLYVAKRPNQVERD